MWRRARWSGLVCLVAAALVSFRDHAEEMPAGAPSRAPARAVDVFDDSFLLDRPRDLTDLPASAEVFGEDFETDDIDPAWRRLPTPGVTVEVTRERAHGGRGSLVFAAPAPAVMLSLERVIAVRPQTTYRLSAYLFAEGLEPVDEAGVGASVELVELDDSGAAPLVEHLHLARERGTSADWRELVYTFRTSERTRHLKIAIEPATGRAQGRVHFDDLKLAEIPRIVDLLESDGFVSGTRGGAPHPLLKRIKVIGNDYRPAILAPAPTRWRWRVAAGDDTLLRFELGLLAAREGSTDACFRVRWQGPEPAAALARPAVATPAATPGGAALPDVLFEKCIHFADPQSRRGWQEVVLDLGQWAGLAGELHFETRGSDGAAALWGNPRLVARRRTPGDARPNIVLLVVDTLRADHLGVEGYPRATSPVLDALARSSVRFSRAYSASPWTAPSMASLMTGRYPSQHHGGIRIEREQRNRTPARRGTGDQGSSAWENRLLGELFRHATALQYHAVGRDSPTLAERLRAAGYDTFGFHSNFNSSGAIGLSRGFDRYEMFSGVSVGGAESGVVLARAVLSGRRRQGEEGPFFLLFHTQDPHIPYRMRRSQIGTFAPSPIDEANRSPADAFRWAGSWAVEFWDWGLLRSGRAQDVLGHVIDCYDSEVAWADRAIGKLLEEVDKIEEVNKVSDTVVVFTADHGEEFGDHGQFEHGHSLYDELLRVPLFVRLPGGRHAGDVVGEPVATVDVAPTLLRLAGAAPLPAAEGRPLFASGAAERRRPRDGILAEAMLRGPERTALVAGRYKYIVSHPLGHLQPFPVESHLLTGRGLTANVGREELYDLESDPGEESDVAAREPEVTARLREEVDAYLRESAHGLHVRCRARNVEIEVASTATFAHVQPVRVEEEDAFEIDATRRRLVVRSKDDESDDWWILRLLEPDAQLTFRASSPEGRARFFVGDRAEPAAERSLSIRLGDPALVQPGELLPKIEGPWCRVWQVPGSSPASSEALDSEIVDQLRALGYLG